MLEGLEGIDIFASPLEITEMIIPLGFSLLGAVVAYFIYKLFYGSRHIGAGVHRTFLVSGPVITMIFLVIQTSIPLGLGMLGTLAIVRFRTPIKDPAEIGFVLLLIASSIGAATSNYLATAILLIIVFAALGIHRLFSNRVSIFSRGHLMISVNQASFPTLEKKLTAFLSQRLQSLNLETMSTIEDRVSLNYQYRRKAGFDWSAFTNDLNQLAGPAKLEVFID
jgi:hypothetical protein